MREEVKPELIGSRRSQGGRFRSFAVGKPSERFRWSKKLLSITLCELRNPQTHEELFCDASKPLRRSKKSCEEAMYRLFSIIEAAFDANKTAWQSHCMTRDQLPAAGAL